MYLIRSVDIQSCAKMSGALYGALALLVMPFGIIGILVGLAKGEGSTIGLSLLFVIAPLLYGVLGFLIGAIAAWVYNLVAGRVGGIEIELAETPQSSSSAVQLGLK
jgi:hypothetical protein